MLSDRNLIYELLVPDLQGRLSMLHIELPAGFSNKDKPFAHPGEECELACSNSVAPPLPCWIPRRSSTSPSRMVPSSVGWLLLPPADTGVVRESDVSPIEFVARFDG